MRLITAENGVRYLHSDLLGCPNGFSTRVGGVSRLEHTASLNLARGRGDGDETVIENLKLFADAVGVDAESVVSLTQVHSSRVLILDASARGQGYFLPSDLECDGYATLSRSLSLAVKTADCVPILLSARDESGKVFAVSALHAGWRGTALGIAERGIEALVSLGATPDRICAAIGPSIGQCCFEVDVDCYDALRVGLGEMVERNTCCQGEKFYPDLKSINRELLVKCGVKRENIDVSELCTACRTDLFYSHRKSGGARGTLLSVISLN